MLRMLHAAWSARGSFLLIGNGTTEPLASQSNWTGSKRTAMSKHGRSVIEAIKCICHRLSVCLSRPCKYARVNSETARPTRKHRLRRRGPRGRSVRMHNRPAPSCSHGKCRRLYLRHGERHGRARYAGVPGQTGDGAGLSSVCRTCYLHTPAL